MVWCGMMGGSGVRGLGGTGEDAVHACAPGQPIPVLEDQSADLALIGMDTIPVQFADDGLGPECCIGLFEKG